MKKSSNPNILEEISEEFDEELEKRLRILVVRGWEMGKEQVKKPYNYICNTDIAEEDWKFIKSFIRTSNLKLINHITGMVERKKNELMRNPSEEDDTAIQALTDIIQSLDQLKK